MSSSETQLIRFSDEVDCQFAMQLVSASVFPMAFKAAIDLGVLEIIDRAGPGTHLSPSQIASELPTQNPEAPALLDRMLRLLASHHVLTCTLISLGDGQVQRLYGLAPVCKYFVPNQDGASLTPLLQLIQDKVFMESWCHRKDAILEGGHPFDKAYGMSVSEHMGKNPGIGKIFKSSMEDYNSMFMKKTLEIYKGFEGLKSVVDVGGGDGKILNMIISKYPEIKGINFDLPQVINNAPVYQGVEHIAGDMFESVPKGDAIFMKWILHTRSDESCLELLKICYEALPDDGKVIIVDLVIPESPDTSVSAKGIFQFDLLNLNPEGKERSKRQFEDLAKEAGFGSVEVVWCVYDFSVIEFYKRR